MKKPNIEKMSQETGLSSRKIRGAINPFNMFFIKEESSKIRTIKELKQSLKRV